MRDRPAVVQRLVVGGPQATRRRRRAPPPHYGCCVASTVHDPAPPVQRTLKLVDSHTPRLTTGRPRSNRPSLLLLPSWSRDEHRDWTSVVATNAMVGIHDRAIAVHRTRSRGAGRRRQCFHGNSRHDDRLSVQCSSPPLRPTLRTGMGRIARADHMAIVKPSASRPRSRSDAAPRLHETVDLAPPGHRPPRRMFQRSPASSLNTRRTAFSEPRRPDGGANQGALFRLTGNRRWPIWPHGTPDRADPPAARSQKIA